MVEYTSCGIYITSATTLADKVARIDSIITLLLDAAATSAGNQGRSEYWLDDGQVKIKEVFRSSSSIFDAINTFERLKQTYLNQLNGRATRLVDSKNFIRRRFF